MYCAIEITKRNSFTGTALIAQKPLLNDICLNMGQAKIPWDISNYYKWYFFILDGPFPSVGSIRLLIAQKVG